MKHDLETIRAGVAERLGALVVAVIKSERDHGFFRGIGITTPDGWRQATVVGDDDSDKEVAARLMMAINERARHLATAR